MEKGFNQPNFLTNKQSSYMSSNSMFYQLQNKGGKRKKHIFWIFYKIFYIYIQFKLGIIIYCLTKNSHWCLKPLLWFCLPPRMCYFAQENISWPSQHHFSIVSQLILPYLCQIFTKSHRSFCYDYLKLFIIFSPFQNVQITHESFTIIV